MLQKITSLLYQNTFYLICQHCHVKTSNEYLGSHRFRVTCPHCGDVTVLTFDFPCWSGLPLHASSEPESGLINMPSKSALPDQKADVT